MMHIMEMASLELHPCKVYFYIGKGIICLIKPNKYLCREQAR